MIPEVMRGNCPGPGRLRSVCESGLTFPGKQMWIISWALFVYPRPDRPSEVK